MGNQVSSEIEERLLSIDLPVVLTGALDTQRNCRVSILTISMPFVMQRCI
ncbi:Uncharacterised protein [Weissella viridescens]|uniref:Uncharacterized protein n=1 Tax=Weissella viridescens TaxID=1629 RepID=A0A380P7M2_WEIVI|nr:Uncharacterised protein [Weissella viridescens]